MTPMDFSDLKDKVCVMTGGTGILGRAICDALAGNGVRNTILGRDGNSAESLARALTEKHGATCLGVQANFLHRDTLEAAKERIREFLGEVDFLINGAGGNAPEATTVVEQIMKDPERSLEDTFFGLGLDGFDKVFALNFTGTLLPTMVFAREMVKRGQPTARGNKIIMNTPVGHYGQSEDLQGAVLFLLSDISSFITGIVLPVDGGYSAFGGV